jgi:hypothetical protein
MSEKTLDTLAPGDMVVIYRPLRPPSTGKVVRTTAKQVIVSTTGAGGAVGAESRFSKRTGLAVGSAGAWWASHIGVASPEALARCDEARERDAAIRTISYTNLNAIKTDALAAVSAILRNPENRKEHDQ